MNETNCNDNQNYRCAQEVPRIPDNELFKQGHSYEALEEVRLKSFTRPNSARIFTAVYRRLSYDNGANYTNWELLDIY